MEKAIVVAIFDNGSKECEINEFLKEMESLALTAGASVDFVATQARRTPDPKYYIGSGKGEEIASIAKENEIDLIIFSGELSPVQLRNLEELMPAKVIDRTELILDIFAQRARTKEGKLQVELAQLNYALPKLIGYGKKLSRLGGGIGTRGPGETKLEVDRRKIRQRIDILKGEMEEVKRHRELLRKSRKSSQIPVVSLVGYTNAGKSTLLTALTGEEAFKEDLLFATLDPLTRVMEFEGQKFLITDTVGFIRDLPHHLVAAFRSTLEEVLEADILLHVIDISNSGFPGQMETVHQVLEELGAHNKKTINVLNKGDKCNSDEDFWGFKDGIMISALTGQGIEDLKKLIIKELNSQMVNVTLKLPYNEFKILDEFRSKGKLSNVEYKEENILAKGQIPTKYLSHFEKYCKGE